MNELFFITHTLFIMFCSLGALRLGKEALIALIVLFAIFSNLFVTKQITLFGLQATPTDAFTVGIVLSLNLLQEYYGKVVTQKAIWISLVGSAAYILLSQLHLAYIPNVFDTTQAHALALFGMMPRIIGASLFTYFIVQRLDSWLYGILKKKCNNNYFILRNYGSVIISQLFDTILFSFLGLYGIVESVVPLICVSYSIKLLVIGMATPFLWFSKKIMIASSHESVSI